MSDTSNLQDSISAGLSDLTQKQREIARFILDNRHFVAFASASDLGARVDANASTVVRFCQAIGYEGYSDLQTAVRAELPSYATSIQRLTEKRASLDANGDILSTVFATDALNLARTAEALDRAVFDGAVQALGEARDVLVVGAGLSAPAALYLAHSLKVMGLRAQSVLSSGIPLAVELAGLTRDDVVVGISLWRYVRGTVEALRRAREVGAKSIAITDSVVSPLAQLADYAFAASTEGVAHSVSTVGFIAISNALIAALSQAQPERTAEALRAVDEAYQAAHLLLTE
ncbi:MAG: hypothetical protein A2Z04_05005 [Chloroflexi bacterium RBG_16_57_9]|nr:MAG: hypothetical protein A2Z04_05005 [Chloroflexi bacterium RBG_16_57_9]